MTNIDRIVENYKPGITAKRLAEAAGCGVGQVYTVAKDRGLELKKLRPGVKRETKYDALIHACANMGMSKTEAAEHLGLPYAKMVDAENRMPNLNFANGHKKNSAAPKVKTFEDVAALLKRGLTVDEISSEFDIPRHRVIFSESICRERGNAKAALARI